MRFPELEKVMSTIDDSVAETNNSGSSSAYTTDGLQEQDRQLHEGHQQPKSVDVQQLLQEQLDQLPLQLQQEEQETIKPQESDHVHQPTEEPRKQGQQQASKLQQGTQVLKPSGAPWPVLAEEVEQRKEQSEGKELEPLQEPPPEGKQRDKQQKEEQLQVEDEQEQQPEKQQPQEEENLLEGAQQDQQQQPQEQEQLPEKQQQQQEEQQQEEEQQDEQQQLQEQEQQEALPQSAAQREADGSQPQVRKEKSRLSKPVATSSPRLDFIPKPAEPPVDNLIPIRLDIEADGQRYKDIFTWNADDQDSEIPPFVRRLVKDINLPIVFAHYIAQSMQAQIADYRATDNQRPSMEERVQMMKLDLRVNRTLIHDQFLWDVNNPDSDPEGFAKRLCEDLELEDPEIAPAIAVSIREQIHEINKQISSSGRDTRISKKVRRERGVDYSPSSNPPTTALNLMRRPNNKISVLRRRNEWESFEPVIEQLTDKEMEALYAREERSVRMKKQQAEKEDAFGSRYGRM